MPDSDSRHFEVLIVSGSSAGIGAAIGAGRLGAQVALIEDTPVVGGMLANGISNIDAYSIESLSGVFEEFRLRVMEHYRPIMKTDPIFGTRMPMPSHVDKRSGVANDPDQGGRWEPHIADRIFKGMLAELPNVEVFYRHTAVDAIRIGNRLCGVLVEDPRGRRLNFLGDVIVDATHEGDVAAWAGAPYRVGREARSPLEPHAGEIFFFNGTGEMMEGSTGRQDRGVVSYGLRLTLQHYDAAAGDAHILKNPPPGYDKSRYEAAAFSGRLDMPGRKSEMNANPIGNELQEINWTWPEASRAQRRELYETYKNNALCFLYFLQHERKMKQLGLARDEYPDNGNVPYRVFVREARRITGEETMCEADLNPFLLGQGLVPPIKPNGVAVGHYPIDSKPVRSKTDLSRPDKGEGDFYIVNVSTAFQVPYGAIVPMQVENLLVPAALSATHVAFSSVRMDPTWTVTGQAAGIAAVLSRRAHVTVRELRVETLQRELLRQKCRLFFFWDLPLGHPAFAAAQWLALRGIFSGYPDRTFQPDEPLSRAAMAQLLVAAFHLWPSVSGVHFADVPYDHAALREIETLFDNRALGAFGVHPRWPQAGAYNPERDADFSASSVFGDFQPAKCVLWRELLCTMSALRPHLRACLSVDRAGDILRRSMFGAAYAERERHPDHPATRGEAAALIASLNDSAANGNL